MTPANLGQDPPHLATPWAPGAGTTPWASPCAPEKTLHWADKLSQPLCLTPYYVEMPSSVSYPLPCLAPFALNCIPVLCSSAVFQCFSVSPHSTHLPCFYNIDLPKEMITNSSQPWFTAQVHSPHNLAFLASRTFPAFKTKIFV